MEYHRADRPGRSGEWYCLPCLNARRRERKRQKPFRTKVKALKLACRYYGIDPWEVVVAMLAQKGRCRICLKRRKLHIDHNHKTGKFRGLLCFNCNMGLGRFLDDPQIILRAYHYSLQDV